MVLQGPRVLKYWSAWSCKSNFWLHLYETAVHRADVWTHTWVGRRELAREWRVETDWEMKELKQPKPAPGQNGVASGNEYSINPSIYNQIISLDVTSLN